MPEGYLVIKLPFRKGQQTVPKIKTYFQNHEEEVRPAVSGHRVPGPHTLARPASHKKRTSVEDARVLNRKLGDQWLQTHPTAQRL